MTVSGDAEFLSGVSFIQTPGQQLRDAPTGSYR
jgi:hypothetical protein